MATTEQGHQTAGQREQTATGQVLEFELGAETYCVSVDCVTEIVDRGEVTVVPNTPAYVEGVMDLRGRTTSVVDPKVIFGVGTDQEPRRIIVFDPAVVEDRTAVGWLVDDVHQVVDVDGDAVSESPTQDDEAVHGVVKNGDGDGSGDGGFVIWVDPAAVHG